MIKNKKNYLLNYIFNNIKRIFKIIKVFSCLTVLILGCSHPTEPGYGDKKTRTFLFGMQNQYITRYTMSPYLLRPKLFFKINYFYLY